MALVNIKSVYAYGPDAEANSAGIRANLKRRFYIIDRAVAEGAEFVGFPKLSIHGYHFSPGMTWLSLTGPEVKALQKKAAERASGSQFIGPDGKTLAQMPTSTDRNDSKEYVLVYSVPILSE